MENAKIEKYKCDIIIIFEQNKLKRSFFDANIALEKYSMSQILIKCTPWHMFIIAYMVSWLQ